MTSACDLLCHALLASSSSIKSRVIFCRFKTQHKIPNITTSTVAWSAPHIYLWESLLVYECTAHHHHATSHLSRQLILMTIMIRHCFDILHRLLSFARIWISVNKCFPWQISLSWIQMNKLFTSFQRHRWPQTKLYKNCAPIFWPSFAGLFTNCK